MVMAYLKGLIFFLNFNVILVLTAGELLSPHPSRS